MSWRAPTRCDQRAIDQVLIELDGTPNKGDLGANAILGDVAGGGQGRRRRRRAAAVPLRRRRRRPRAAGADDERRSTAVPTPTTTSTCRSSWSCRVGADSFAEALRIGAETFHALKALLHERGLVTAVGDEGGFAPEPGVERGGDRGHPRGGGRGRPPRRAWRSRSTRRSTEIYRDGRYHLDGEGRVLTRPEMVGYLRGSVRPLPDRLDRGRAGRGRLGRLAAADRRRSGRACSWSATTCS